MSSDAILSKLFDLAERMNTAEINIAQQAANTERRFKPVEAFLAQQRSDAEQTERKKQAALTQGLTNARDALAKKGVEWDDVKNDVVAS